MSKISESATRSIPDSLTEICLSAFSMAGGSHAALHCANWGASGEANLATSDIGSLSDRYEFSADSSVRAEGQSTAAFEAAPLRASKPTESLLS